MKSMRTETGKKMRTEQVSSEKIVSCMGKFSSEQKSLCVPVSCRLYLYLQSKLAQLGCSNIETDALPHWCYTCVVLFSWRRGAVNANR